jgi:CheY-like chemotaxis protein
MANPSILVVEDDGIVAKDLQSRLHMMGYPVNDIAYNGREAVEKAESGRPDIILMDIKLSGDMDGVEAAQIIRNKYSIPVIYLTAYADVKTVERAKETRPYGYLIKPIEQRELEATLRKATLLREVEMKLAQAESPKRDNLEKFEYCRENAVDQNIRQIDDKKKKLLKTIGDKFWKELQKRR